MSKIYVNMRKKTSKKGNEYLGGYDKRNETGYFINKNQEGKNSLAKKVGDNSDFVELGELNAREGDYGPYEFIVAQGKVYTLSPSRNAGEPIVRQDGSTVLNDKGEPVLGAPFLLTIKEDQPKES